MKYLITGGCGFIGFHVAKELINRQEEVVIIDNFNDSYDPAIKYGRAKLLSEAIIYEADILDVAKMEEIFSRHAFDKVIHLAARPGVRLSAERPELYIKNNIEGTFNVFESCRQHNVKNVVFASSSSVYSHNEPPFNENQEIKDELSIYAHTKRTNELLAKIYCDSYGMDIVGLRFFSAYGTYGRPDLIFHIISEALLKHETINIYGDGEIQRDFTHVNDIAESIILAANLNVGYEIFNIGNNNPISLNKLIDLIAERLKTDVLKNYQERNKIDMDITLADISKAKNILHWEPKVSLDDGIAELADWHLKKHK